MVFVISLAHSDKPLVILAKLFYEGTVCLYLRLELLKTGVFTAHHKRDHLFAVFKQLYLTVELFLVGSKHAMLFLKRLEIFTYLLFLLLKLCDLACAAEDPSTLLYRAARERAAHVYLLTVKGNCPYLVFKRLCHLGGIILSKTAILPSI